MDRLERRAELERLGEGSVRERAESIYLSEDMQELMKDAADAFPGANLMEEGELARALDYVRGNSDAYRAAPQAVKERVDDMILDGLT